MTSTPADIEAWVRAFVVERLLSEPFAGEDPLAAHELDSLLLEELIDVTEEEYGILLSEEEIARENFSTVARFASVVYRNIQTSPWHGH